MSTTPPVRAAGGAVWRPGPEVLLVHRPRYDDWSLPKGKAETNEDDLETALREVAEETGLVCEPGAELVGTSYVDHNGRAKVVRYWAMTVRQDAATFSAFSANREVDELAWLPLPAARARLSYDRDRAVIDALGALAGRG